MFVNKLALAAGACTIAAGIWRSANGKSWLLVLNGLVLSVYGSMPLFWHGPLRFDFFALLLVVTAMTFGILALAIARTLRRRVADVWLFGLAGAASVGFALALLALANHWIHLEHRLFHPSAFSVALLLLWIQRNLHVGVGTAAPPIGPFPIQSMEPPDTIGKSKTRALGKISLFPAETPVFPANIWKPRPEPITIEAEAHIGI